MSPHLLSGAARLAGSSLLRMQSDERLVALVRDGHDPAFSAVVDRYRAELLRYATKLVGESRAEDIVQQALLSAHMAMTSSDEEIRLRPWLYRIAHNAAVNVLRSSRQEAALDDRLAAAGQGLADALQTRERLHEALVAISRLPEPQRDALTLRALDGRSHQEIADVLGVSPGAARQHVHRARTTVRAAVSAITPYGLIARFAIGDVGDPASAGLTGAGLGVGATAAKIGAGVLAAGALATGAAHLPLATHSHHHQAAHSAREAAATPAIAAAAAAGAVDIAGASTTAPAHRGSATGRHGRSGSLAAEHHGGRGSSEVRSPGSGPSHGDDSHSGSSGSGDSHSGSGSVIGTSGSGDHSGSSGSSGSDGGTSGTSGGDSTTSGTTTTTSGSGSDGGSGETITTSGLPSGSDGKTSGGSGTSGSSDGGIDGGATTSTDG